MVVRMAFGGKASKRRHQECVGIRQPTGGKALGVSESKVTAGERARISAFILGT